jgi:hypothetical protein
MHCKSALSIADYMLLIPTAEQSLYKFMTFHSPELMFGGKPQQGNTAK